MLWLLFGILTRFLWAICNLVDQYIARYFSGSKGNGLGAAAMLQNLFVLPVILVLILTTGLPAWPDGRIFIWLGLGALTNALGLVPYLRAIQLDDAHNAIPLFEISPVFVIVLSWVFFGEVMHPHQLFGALLIIISGFLFMWDFQNKKLKSSTLLLMLLSAFLYSFYQLCIRPASLALDEWSVAIYFFSGIFIMGLLMAAARREWCGLLIATVRQSRGKILAATLVSNSLWCASAVTLTLAMARAPGAGYVSALSGVQPIFVLMLSWLAGLIGLPHFRRLSWTHDLKVKLFLLPLLLAGIFLLRL